MTDGPTCYRCHRQPRAFFRLILDGAGVLLCPTCAPVTEAGLRQLVENMPYDFEALVKAHETKVAELLAQFEARSEAAARLRDKLSATIAKQSATLKRLQAANKKLRENR